jgi:hypothetical protein
MTQLALEFTRTPRDGGELLARLRDLGLRSIERCALTNNARTMVSFRGSELRVHRGYLTAPEDVLRAIVTLVQSRTRVERRIARRTLLEFPVETKPRVRRPDAPHPDDEPMAIRLRELHAQYNADRFGASLGAVRIRVSRKMRRRLGQFTPSDNGGPGEIAISRRHIRRHGWADAAETLVHEMVHQWQVETGHPLDHGRAFRQKAIEVGIPPRAKRPV